MEIKNNNKIDMTDFNAMYLDKLVAFEKARLNFEDVRSDWANRRKTSQYIYEYEISKRDMEHRANEACGASDMWHLIASYICSSSEEIEKIDEHLHKQAVEIAKQ